MADNDQRQRDFFSELMFGRKMPDENNNHHRPTEEKKDKQSQLELILTTIQTLGPTIEKITPFVGLVSDYFKQRMNQEENHKNQEKKQTDDN